VAETDPLLRVCSLLNAHSAKYLVIGGHACILHGLVRTTEDVDILVEDSDENLKKVIAALSEMEYGAAKELTPRDLLENVVVKIADEVEVDVSRSAWRISFNDAIDSALHVEIDGVDVPYVDLKTLIATKQTPTTRASRLPRSTASPRSSC
jgi:predicted nucleotidyltransferase